MYHEGGMYMDIDRLTNRPLSDIISENRTRMILPINVRARDLSQDIMGSAPRNALFREAINLNLQWRRECKVTRLKTHCGILTLGPGSFNEAATKHIYGIAVKRHDGDYIPALFSSLQSLNPTLVTAKEIAPLDTLMHKGGTYADVSKLKEAKMELYSASKIKHWEVAQTKLRTQHHLST